jgi:hypothetical protein
VLLIPRLARQRLVVVDDRLERRGYRTWRSEIRINVRLVADKGRIAARCWLGTHILGMLNLSQPLGFVADPLAFGLRTPFSIFAFRINHRAPLKRGHHVRKP